MTAISKEWHPPAWVIVAVFLAFLSLVGFILVAASDDQSRWAGFGSDLASAAGVGGVLTYFGHTVSERVTSEQKAVRAGLARTAAPDLPQDDMAATPPPESSTEHPAPTAVPRQAPKKLFAEIEHWGVDTSRLDADQLRVRTYDEAGKYFQFFTVIVPGIHFRVVIHQPGSFTFEEFKQAVFELSLREIRRAVDDNEVPLPNPAAAFELFPDLEEAGRNARHIGKPLVEGVRVEVP